MTKEQPEFQSGQASVSLQGQQPDELILPAQAEAWRQQALQLSPLAQLGWFRLGDWAEQHNLPQQAIYCYRQALEQVLPRDPLHALCHERLGHLLFLGQNHLEAEQHYLLALEQDSQLFGAALNLGCIYFARRQFRQAEHWVRQAIALRPDNPAAWENLAEICRQRQKLADAGAAYARVWQRQHRPDLMVRHALLFPMVFATEAEIPIWLERFAAGLAQLTRAGIQLHNPSRQVGVLHANLHYAGPPWTELARQLAVFFRQACPGLASQAPHCALSARRPGERLRLGIVTPNFKQHSLGRMFGQLVPELDRSRFEVVLCSSEVATDMLGQRLAAAADQYLTLPNAFFAARSALARQGFDILLYPEIGGDPQSYYLGFARLAPLQLALWGLGSSTGLPQIDAY
ncbi:MAG: hypothetical protein CVV27_14335, partial [Candidatus Melainabacteria bacterium HGW-Melainabacteria-1]